MKTLFIRIKTAYRTTIHCALLASLVANFFAYEAPIRAHLAMVRDVEKFNPVTMAAMDSDGELRPILEDMRRAKQRRR